MGADYRLRPKVSFYAASRRWFDQTEKEDYHALYSHWYMGASP